MLVNSLVLFALLIAAGTAAPPIKQLLLDSNRVPTETAECPRLHRRVDISHDELWYLPSGEHQISPSLFDAGACPPGCEPNSFEPLSVIYTNDEGRFFIGRIADVIVVDCRPTMFE